MYKFITHIKIENPSPTYIQEEWITSYLPTVVDTTYTIENLQYNKRPAVKLILDSGGEETTAVGQ